MSELLIDFAHWFRPYQSQCAMAIIATLLVLFGSEVTQAIRQLIKKQHIILRTAIFVIVCAFGYGAATVWLTGVFARWLAQVPDVYLMPSILAIFVMLGLYAQKQRHI